jgi:hypothetical protein
LIMKLNEIAVFLIHFWGLSKKMILLG